MGCHEENELPHLMKASKLAMRFDSYGSQSTDALNHVSVD